MTRLDFTAPLLRPAPFTRDQIAARIPALPEGWTAQDDHQMLQSLGKGLGLGRIAAMQGHTLTVTSERFLALKKAAVGEGVLNLAAQQLLTEIITERYRKTQEAA